MSRNDYTSVPNESSQKKKKSIDFYCDIRAVWSETTLLACSIYKLHTLC